MELHVAMLPVSSTSEIPRHAVRLYFFGSPDRGKINLPAETAPCHRMLLAGRCEAPIWDPRCWQNLEHPTGGARACALWLSVPATRLIFQFSHHMFTECTTEASEKITTADLGLEGLGSHIAGLFHQ